VVSSPVTPILCHTQRTITYDHRLKRIGHPVRSAIHKLEIGGLVVGWVTTSEYPLLYVFFFVSLVSPFRNSDLAPSRDRNPRATFDPGEVLAF
jgi:hypothetical protein